MKTKQVAGMKATLAAMVTEAQNREYELNALVIGRPVKILSDWNGQPYGRSRRSRKGDTVTVEGARIDTQWGVYLRIRGERLTIRETEVEWL